MRQQRVLVLVEVALSVALAAVLSIWKITLPWNFAGGSISLAMLPLFVIALRRGVVVGVVAGLTFGFVDYLIEPWFVHPVQVLLDYGVAFAACGLAGIGSRTITNSLSEGAHARAGYLSAGWSLLGGAGRFAASFISGIVFFSQNAPEGQAVWLYSLAYNASYLVPSVVICAALAGVLVPALDRAAPLPRPVAR